MRQIPQISESELMLMKIIWERGGRALYADIMGALESAGTEIKKNTALTFLARLVDKGMLAIEKIGRRNIYTALASEEAYQAEQTRQFVKKVYGGSVQGLVNMLVDGDLASEDDISALREYFRGGKADE